MLIRIDDSVIEELVPRAPGSDTLLICLENLLRAHAGQKHIVALSAPMLRALELFRAELSKEARAAAIHIFNNRHPLEGLARQVPYRLDLGLGPAFDGRMDEEAGRRVIRADLRYFEDYERAGRSVLVAENLTDAELYQLLGRALVTAKRWQMKVDLELRNGGGDTIGGVFAEVVRAGRIALGLADSDQRFPPPAHQRHDPRAGLGKTAKALLGAAPEQGVQRAYVIHARELENLLPFEVYEDALAPHQRPSPSIPEQLQTLDRAIPAHRLPWRTYADLKEGLRLRDLEAMPDGDEERFWSEVARAAGRDRCRDPEGCRAAGKCECYVVPGLGKERVLARAVKWLSAQSPARIVRLLELDRDPARDPELDALCTRIAAWGSALPQRVRT